MIDAGTSRGGVAAYHAVVVGNSSAPTYGAVLDGFGIKNGSAVGLSSPYSYDAYRGGGIYNYLSSPVIANCMIYTKLRGKSAAAAWPTKAPTSAARITWPKPTVVNCVFWNNTARRDIDYIDPSNDQYHGGGAVFNHGGSATANPVPKFYNCSIAATRSTTAPRGPAPDNFGIPFTYDGDATATTAWGAATAAFYNAQAQPIIRNSIVWYNKSVNSGTDYYVGYQTQSDDARKVFTKSAPGGRPRFRPISTIAPSRGGSFSGTHMDTSTDPYFVDVTTTGDLELKHTGSYYSPSFAITSIFY